MLTETPFPDDTFWNYGSFTGNADLEFPDGSAAMVRYDAIEKLISSSGREVHRESVQEEIEHLNEIGFAQVKKLIPEALPVVLS